MLYTRKIYLIVWYVYVRTADIVMTINVMTINVMKRRDADLIEVACVVMMMIFGGCNSRVYGA